MVTEPCYSLVDRFHDSGSRFGNDRVNDPTSGKTAIAHKPYSTLVTFSPHPREFFTGEHKPLLTPIDEKIVHLRSIGLEQLVLLPFNHALANLTPAEFVEQILAEGLQAQFVSVGQDFCFGRKRSGTVHDLQAIAAGVGITVNIATLQRCGQERISSSAIRHALLNGQVEEANRWLGRPYVLQGSVEFGQQLGRTIGFPTANLRLPSDKFVPCRGVYSVWVLGAESGSQAIAGVMNIGNRPTVDGQAQTVEVHLLDWAGDLYGKTLQIQLVQYLRSEQKFDSLDHLKQQIQRDCDQARSHLQ